MPVRRRPLLRVAGLASATALAGCADQGDDHQEEQPSTDAGETDESPDETDERTDKTDDHENGSESEPAPPEITTLDFQIPDEDSRLTYEITVQAEDILEEVWIETDAGTETISGGDSIIDTTGSLPAEGGQINDITVSATTVDGGDVTVERKQYARNFAVYADDVAFDFSPHYLLFWDGGRTKTFDEAGVGMPEGGPYSQTVADFNRQNRETFERHFDWMRGHGINRVQFNFGEGDAERDRIRMYRDEVELFHQMEIEFSHPIIQAFRRDRDIFADYEVMTEILAGRDNIGTIDGRHVIYFWGFSGLYHDDELYQEIVNEYGGLEALVNEIRDALTVDDTDPFLVPDIGSVGETWVNHGHDPDDLYDAILACDGVSHWDSGLLNPPGPGQASPQEYFDSMRDRILGTREFADSHKLEYIPLIIPGFDDRDNEIWGEGRFSEPSPDLLGQMADLAVEHSTVDLSFVATWNDWAEGHMIEPGTYDGDEFGTAYLETLRDRTDG